MKEFNTREAEGDYSITFNTDDEKAFEKVQTLCRILIDGKDGGAIPIEWILNHPKFPLKNEDRKKCILDMIEDWEKENETD